MESAQSVCWMRLTIFCLSLHRRYETSICPSDDERRSTIGNNRWVFLGLSSVYSSDILLTIYLLLSVCRFWRYTNASATSAQTTPSFWNAVGKLLLRCFLFHSIGILLTILHFPCIFRLGRFTNSSHRRRYAIANLPTTLRSRGPYRQPTDVIASSSGCCGESSHVNGNSRRSRRISQCTKVM